MNDIILPQTAYTAVSKKISELYAAGINGIPAYGAQAPKGISPKAPIGTWKRWQNQPMPATFVKQLILGKPESVGAVTGSYAGNLEALDFDSIDAYEQFLEAGFKCGIGDLIERIATGYDEKSPKGRHYLYRIILAPGEIMPGNEKWARSKPDDNGKSDTLIESRGEGGFIILAPSFNGSYSMASGGVESIETITAIEREQLKAVAAMVCQNHEPENTLPKNKKTETKSPAFSSKMLKVSEGTITDFNNSITWKEILTADGWTELHTQGAKTFWKRPGKDDDGCSGVSGPGGKAKGDSFTCFSSNGPNWLPDKPTALSKFDYIMYRDYGGNMNAFLVALRGELKTVDKISFAPEETRPEIVLKVGRLHESRLDTISEIVKAMEAAGDTVLLNHKGTCSDVFIHREKVVKGTFEQPAGMATIRRTSESLIRLTLSQHLDFVSWSVNKTGEPVARTTDAPLALVKAISDEPAGLIQLHFLAHGPYINFKDKVLVNSAGIDKHTCRYLVNEVEGLEELIPDSPTRADAVLAVATLWNAVKEFPWLYNHQERCQLEDNMLNEGGSREDRIINQSFVKWLCLLVAQAVRLELDTVPLGLITANTPGLGKSYLAHAIPLILFGRTASVTTLPEGSNMQNRGDELRKRIISQIEGGETFTLIDNVSRTSGADFSSPELEAFITSSDFSDRQLGSNTKKAGGRHRMQIVVTGNGTSPGEDLADRTLFVKLESSEPNRRHHFTPTNGDFLEYCRQHRKELLAATLTIVKAWLVAGSPKPHTANGFGSFPDFNRIPIAMIHWTTGIDPLDGRLDDIRESDTKAQSRAALISNWTELLGTEPLTCGQILERIKSPSLGNTYGSEQISAFKEALLELVPGTFRVDDLPAAKQLGKALRAMSNTPTYLPANESAPASTGKIHDGENRQGSAVYTVIIKPYK